ncbi:MAG: hypothetical protein ACYTBV_06645 [Planctomycetota bacterium]|jgi:hypothetical protein
MKYILSFVSLIAVSICCVSFAAPRPAVVQGRGEWTVDVKFNSPQLIELVVDRTGRPQRFWYTIITITNKTNRDVDFYPKCELMTDTFQIIPAGKGVSGVVFENIKRRHQGLYPFLESHETTNSKILQGEDNTRDIAIIWPDFDSNARNIRIFIAGLSNETVVIEHPALKDEKGKQKPVFLRKTLVLDYTLGGDPAFRSTAKILFKGRDWVMR